jgi:NADH-quinone oxidoreductase subunit J
MPVGLPALAFGLMSAMILLGAVWVVTLRNLFRAALSLGLVLLGVAGVFLLLAAEFLAFVQILVYVGAVLTLVVFAIMVTAGLQGSPAVSAHRQRLPAALACLGLLVALAVATQGLVWPAAPSEDAVPLAGGGPPLATSWPSPPPGGEVTLAALGQQLVTTLVLPFEVISLVFVAAMVGAIALAAHRPKPPPA